MSPVKQEKLGKVWAITVNGFTYYTEKQDELNGEKWAIYYQMSGGSPACFMDYGTFETKRAVVEFLQDFEPQFGLLTPQGKLILCGYTGHDSLYYILRPKDKNCWDMADNGSWMHFSHGHFNPPMKSMTQKQMDFIFDWVESKPDTRKYPTWWNQKNEYINGVSMSQPRL
jgi:hypothetical protein